MPVHITPRAPPDAAHCQHRSAAAGWNVAVALVPALDGTRRHATFLLPDADGH